jgi:hypothetical protein
VVCPHHHNFIGFLTPSNVLLSALNLYQKERMEGREGGGKGRGGERRRGEKVLNPF